VYYRKPGTTEPDGHIAEAPAIALYTQRPPMPRAAALKAVNNSVQLWLENGFTTANELGLGISADDPEMARLIVDEKLIPIDLGVATSGARLGARARARFPLGSPRGGPSRPSLTSRNALPPPFRPPPSAQSCT
jgi:hypothetical protein